jgi:hypothetical protein
MSRAFTLFTGQWADLPLEEVCRLAHQWGYDGLELACWGDHFEVDRALGEDGYLAGRHALLAKYELRCWAISNHLVGQAVCDHPIDVRHQGILPARICPRGFASGPPPNWPTPRGPPPRSGYRPWWGSPAPRSGTRWPCSRRSRRR